MPHFVSDAAIVVETAGDVRRDVFHAETITVDKEHGEGNGAIGKLPAQHHPTQPVVPETIANQTIDDGILGRSEQTLGQPGALDADK